MTNTIYQKIIKVQNELKVPKSQTNTFANYKYRSAEDILENAKPLCIKNGLLLNVSDEVVFLGDRYYIKAIASLTDCESGEKISVNGYAREQSEKKGLDQSQITGTASSYARKYALNGLFAIDDTKDADTDEHANQTKGSNKKEVIEYATDEQREQIQELLGFERVSKMLEYYKIKTTKELPYKEAQTIIDRETKK